MKPSSSIAKRRRRAARGGLAALVLSCLAVVVIVYGQAFDTRLVRQHEAVRLSLQGVDLRGVDLSQVKLGATPLRGAWYDSSTVFPPGFDPTKHGMKKVADNAPP